MPEVRGAESPETVFGVQRVAEWRPAVIALLGGGLSDERPARPDLRTGRVPGGLNRLIRLVRRTPAFTVWQPARVDNTVQGVVLRPPSVHPPSPTMRQPPAANAAPAFGPCASIPLDPARGGRGRPPSSLRSSHRHALEGGGTCSEPVEGLRRRPPFPISHCPCPENVRGVGASAAGPKLPPTAWFSGPLSIGPASLVGFTDTSCEHRTRSATRPASGTGGSACGGNIQRRTGNAALRPSKFDVGCSMFDVRTRILSSVPRFPFPLLRRTWCRQNLPLIGIDRICLV